MPAIFWRRPMQGRGKLTVILAPFLLIASYPAQQVTQYKSAEGMTSAMLLECAGTDRCLVTQWEIAEQLRKRFNAKALIEMYPRQNESVRKVIVMALYPNRHKAVRRFMRQAAFDGLNTGQTTEDNHYYSLQYLARRCDSDALRELNRPANFGHNYPVACIAWQDTLREFGSCRYSPAAAHLAMSLGSACLNNTDAALGSLQKLMPRSSCRKQNYDVEGLEKARDCYLKEAQQESKEVVTPAPSQSAKP